MKRIIVVSIGLVLLMGCSSKRNTGGSVTGTVTYNGKPVNRAMLFFHPTSGEGKVKDIDVTTSQDGTFTASNLPPGEYKIYIQDSRVPKEAMKGPQVPKGKDQAKSDEMQKKFEQMRGGAAGSTTDVPKKYKDVNSTDLKCTITEGQQVNLPIELKD